MVNDEFVPLRKAALDNAVTLAASFARQGEYDALMDSTRLATFGEAMVLPLADVFYAWLVKEHV
ncbi:hypothetical protein COT72_01310 [archaeon CG10_big_fil_rev_8_21_14_0_10_43_11]|nr:MAG: hypothetical protein COT72_01310 [archaeon CG10_big_fil_rev_8_21_14_0_10_43_11]